MWILMSEYNKFGKKVLEAAAEFSQESTLSQSISKQKT